MATGKPAVGWVEIVLYAGLREAEPIEVGTVRVPLTLSGVRAKTVEASLEAAVEYVAESFRRVYEDEQ